MEKLTKQMAIEKVQEIADLIWDNEVAHVKEDDLKDYFIQCCINELYCYSEIIEIGKIVNSVSLIEYDRWYA